MKLIFAPFRTSSTPIRTPMPFRLLAMQTMPQTNSTAATRRYGVSPTSFIELAVLRDEELTECVRAAFRLRLGGDFSCATAFGSGEIGRTNQDDEQVDGDDFERQEVAGAERSI